MKVFSALLISGIGVGIGAQSVEVSWAVLYSLLSIIALGIWKAAVVLTQIRGDLKAGDTRMGNSERRIDSLESGQEDHERRISRVEGKVLVAAVLLLLPSLAVAQGGVFGPDLPLHYQWFPWMAACDSVMQAQYPSVPTGACQAFAWGESDYDTTAVRFEPKYLKNYRTNLVAHARRYFKRFGQHRSLETELEQRATSYQMHQNMGENLRQAGFTQPTIGAITTEQDIRMFYWTMDSLIRSYKRIHGVHHTTREVFLDATAAYNGGAKAAYPYQARGHYRRNWDYVADKERRLKLVAGTPAWGEF